MKIKNALVGLTLCFSACFLPLACSGDPGQTTSTVTSGAGGESTVSSSSSSSSGQGGTSGSGGMGGAPCDGPATCDECLTLGCPPNQNMCLPQSEYDKFSKIAQCISTANIQDKCPDCHPFVVPTDFTISDACLQCASENQNNPPCELSCETCGKYDILTTCEECTKYGCEFNKPLPGQCYGGVVFYTDIIGCLQDNAVQQNCPACLGINSGMPIDPACVGCAKKYVNPTCRLSCESMLP